jgi:hypothetical protein
MQANQPKYIIVEATKRMNDQGISRARLQNAKSFRGRLYWRFLSNAIYIMCLKLTRFLARNGVYLQMDA